MKLSVTGALLYYSCLVLFCFVLFCGLFVCLFYKKEPTSLKIPFYLFIKSCETGMPFWNWMLAEDKLAKKLRYYSVKEMKIAEADHAGAL